MDYFQYNVKCSPETVEVLIALMGELPFDTFEDQDNGFVAYIAANLLSQDIENQLIELQQQFEFSIEKTFIPYQNWNEIWESNFQPIVVADFCAVRADFHTPNTNVKYDLGINPKMAFGTGHHETTYMMMEAMENIDFRDKKVWDYGCGTGILGILAAKLGAKTVVANDIEQPSFENTIENSAINAINNIEVRLGDKNVVKEHDFDIILANINRNVILESLPTLYEKLKKNGILLISGFILNDEVIMIQALEQQGLTVKTVRRRNHWLCILLSR